MKGPKKVKQKRALTRTEVSYMLGWLPTNDTELLEIMLGVLMEIVDDYPDVNLKKATEYLNDIAEGYSTGDKDTDRYIRAKKYFIKHNLWIRISEDMDDLYS